MENTLIVTIHAFLRYLNRIENIQTQNDRPEYEVLTELLLNNVITGKDLKNIQKKLTSPYVTEKVEVLGDGVYPISKKSHVMAVIRGDRVITVYNRGYNYGD